MRLVLTRWCAANRITVTSVCGSFLFHVTMIGAIIVAGILCTDTRWTSAPVEQISLEVVLDDADEVPLFEPVMLRMDPPRNDELPEVQPQVQRKFDVTMHNPLRPLSDVESEVVPLPKTTAAIDQPPPEPVPIERKAPVQVERRRVKPPAIATRVAVVPHETTAPRKAPLSALPQLVRRTEAEYPVALRNRGIEGTVLLQIVVDETGRVTDAAVKRSSGYAQLDRAAIAAAQTWQFTPARRADQPVTLRVTMPVEFRIVR